MSSSMPAAGDAAASLPHIVQLNVGGSRFTTSLETLQKPGTMLGGMFSGLLNSRQDEQGAFFVDRDPKHFTYVLNYLRDGCQSCTLPANQAEKLELLREAQFYGLEGLVVELEAATGGLVSGLQQRIIETVFARPELRTIKDYILKVAFDGVQYTPGHLLGVAVCLSCTPQIVKIRASSGVEVSELIIDAAMEHDQHQEVSKSIRYCCQYKWVLPPYFGTLKLGLVVADVDSQLLSQSAFLAVQLSWSQMLLGSGFARQLYPIQQEQMKVALEGRYVRYGS